MFAPPQKSSGMSSPKPGSTANTTTPSNMNQNMPNPQGGSQYGGPNNGPARPNNGNGWNNGNQSAYNNNSMSSSNTVATIPQNGQNPNMNGKNNQLVPPGQKPMMQNGQNQGNPNQSQFPQNGPNGNGAPPGQWGTGGNPNQSQFNQNGPGNQSAPGQWGNGGQNPQQKPGQWGNQPQNGPYQGPVASGNGKQLKKGEKKRDPTAPSTNFQTACNKAPNANTRDRSIIYWDHNNENFVYGEQEYDFQGRLTKREINGAVSSLSGDPSWNPTKNYETCIIGYGAWVAAVIIVVVVIVAGYTTETGTKDFTWVVYAAGAIAIIFGGILAICCREMANRMSWRKRLLMFGVLDKLEQTNLAGTDMGIRSGKEAAWIEYGLKSSLDKFRPWYIPVAQNQPGPVTVTPPPQQQQQYPPPPIQNGPQNNQSQFVPARNEQTQQNFVPTRTEQTQSNFAPARTEPTNQNQQSRWVEMSNQPNTSNSGYGPTQTVTSFLISGIKPQTSQANAFYTETKKVPGQARNAKEWCPCSICCDNLQDVRLYQARARDHI